MVYLENLLSDNLDNLTSQQKYYELELENKQETIKRKQAAMETLEKQSKRDKMIINFREKRITALESKEDNPSEECEQLRTERDEWREAVEKNAQAAKLFAENAELQKKIDQL